MTAIDIAFGVLAGVVSCLTPEALLLLPLPLGAAGATGRAGVIALSVGLGLSLVLTGLLAGSFGFLFGCDAIWFRRVMCALLGLQGIALMSVSLVDRYPRLTGGLGGVFGDSDESSRGGTFRLLLLALVVGSNWIPLVGPTLGKASLLAADTWNSGLALGVLFAFGAAAAVPWIILGRIVRVLVRPFAGGVLYGMPGKRLLGFSLLAVAILGGSGLDIAVAHQLDATLPAWTAKLAITF